MYKNGKFCVFLYNLLSLASWALCLKIMVFVWIDQWYYPWLVRGILEFVINQSIRDKSIKTYTSKLPSMHKFKKRMVIVEKNI